MKIELMLKIGIKLAFKDFIICFLHRCTNDQKVNANQTN